MCRALVGAALALLITCGSAAGQSAGGESPFDFTFGPQEDGHLGAILTGKRFYALSRIDAAEWDSDRTVLVSPFAGVQVDGGWSGAPDALNNASVSFRPAVGISRIGRRIIPHPVTSAPDTVPTTAGPWLYLYGDARQRFGKLRLDDDVDPEPLNQTMLGIGVQLRWAGFASAYASLLESVGLDTGRDDAAPSLDLTYYSVRSSSTSLPALPEGVTTDALQSRLGGEVTLPLLCSRRVTDAPPDPDDPFGQTPEVTVSCPFALNGELTRSWSVGGADGGVLVDVRLLLATGSHINPVLRYRAGDEHGLEYDRQFLLGVLWKLSQ